MFIPPPTDWTKHPLHVAAMSFNLHELERLLSLGADVNEHVPFEGTPLHLAIRHGSGSISRDLVRLLLERGAEVRPLRAFGRTPLNEAAFKGDCDIAEMLLTNGADINSKDSRRLTPLHCAVDAGKPWMVDFLIAKGANVDAVADFQASHVAAALLPCCGMTPLHVAIRKGYAEIARTLIAAGASLNIKVEANQDSLEGFTAYELALHFQECAERNEQRFLRESEDLLKLLKAGTADLDGLSALRDFRRRREEMRAEMAETMKLLERCDARDSCGNSGD